jgi:hypothetical protein
MVSLWYLLSVLSVGAALGGAIAAAHAAGGGALRASIAGVLGLAVGIACTMAPLRLRDRLARADLTEGQLRLVYFGLFLWLGVSVWLGAAITRAVLHLVVR